jgi:hypothetical protein
VAELFVVIWCAVRTRACSFSLSILCLFVGLDCTVVDNQSHLVISWSDDLVF